jgi:hypothetical protein
MRNLSLNIEDYAYLCPSQRDIYNISKYGNAHALKIFLSPDGICYNYSKNHESYSKIQENYENIFKNCKKISEKEFLQLFVKHVWHLHNLQKANPYGLAFHLDTAIKHFKSEEFSDAIMNIYVLYQKIPFAEEYQKYLILRNDQLIKSIIICDGQHIAVSICISPDWDYPKNNLFIKPIPCVFSLRMVDPQIVEDFIKAKFGPFYETLSEIENNTYDIPQYNKGTHPRTWAIWDESCNKVLFEIKIYYHHHSDESISGREIDKRIFNLLHSSDYDLSIMYTKLKNHFEINI